MNKKGPDRSRALLSSCYPIIRKPYQRSQEYQRSVVVTELSSLMSVGHGFDKPNSHVPSSTPAVESSLVASGTYILRNRRSYLLDDENVRSWIVVTCACNITTLDAVVTAHAHVFGSEFYTSSNSPKTPEIVRYFTRPGVFTNRYDVKLAEQ